MKHRKESYIHYKAVEWEDWSDTAIRFNVLVYFRTSEAPVIKKMFAPKSLLKGDSLPYWFIRQKYQEQVTLDMAGWKVKGDLKTPERLQ